MAWSVAMDTFRKSQGAQGSPWTHRHQLPGGEASHEASFVGDPGGGPGPPRLRREPHRIPWRPQTCRALLHRLLPSKAGSSHGPTGPSAPDGELEQVSYGPHLSVDDQPHPSPGARPGTARHSPSHRSSRPWSWGKKGSATMGRPPRQVVLEPSRCRTLPKAHSARLRATLRLRTIPATFKCSTTILPSRPVGGRAGASPADTRSTASISEA